MIEKIFNTMNQLNMIENSLVLYPQDQLNIEVQVIFQQEMFSYMQVNL